MLRLDDYDYEPAVGDIDHPESFDYRVYYHVVRGLTFEMAQSGVMTEVWRHGGSPAQVHDARFFVDP